MKSSIEKVNNLQRKINIEVPAEIVSSAFEKLFKSIQKDAELKGFRKGKAPIDTIKKIYKDKANQDVAEKLIQQHYFLAINEHKVTPINWPQFDFDVPELNKNFSFSAVFEVRPEVVLKQYEGLELKKEKYTFDDSKVDKVLENIRSSRAEIVDLKEDRPVQKGDLAVIDFDGSIDGAPLEGGQGNGYRLEIGSKSFIDGFEEGLIGMKVGETRTLSLKFPEDYNPENLAGKAVQFVVKLHEIKVKVLPELNEELLKSLGGPGDVEALKKTIREDLEESDKKRIDNEFKNHVLKALVKANPVDVPESLMADQKKALIENFKNKMSEQRVSPEEFEMYIQKWDQDFSNTAAEIIQANFLVEEIANKHDLKASKEDIDKRLNEYAVQTGIDFQRLTEFYGREEQHNRLAYQITEEKVLKLITDKAKISEVAKEELAPL
jgi:trigger factor